MNSDADAYTVERVVEAIRPLLAGHSPEIQGAVLADLLAMFLAGHQGGDAEAAREKILQMHIEIVRKLIPLNEQMIRERMQ